MTDLRLETLDFADFRLAAWAENRAGIILRVKNL